MRETTFIDCYGRSDIGKERKKNEDAFLIAGLSKSMNVQQTSLSIADQTQLQGGMQGQLFVVADGMGGHAAGERASSLAIQTLTSYVLNTMPWFFNLGGAYEGDLKEQLVTALRTCRENLEADTVENPERSTMGTTLTLAYLLWPKLYLVHVGDSRCYIMRNRELHQVTRDHTVAERLVEKGALDEAEARESRMSDVIWNVVSADKETELDPDVFKITLAQGDILLLCTDGLTKQLSNDEIAKVLKFADSAESATQQFVEAAYDAGGADNTTVIIARFQADARTLDDTRRIKTG